MDEAARRLSIRDFESKIYSIWAGIEKADAEAEAKLTSAEVNAPGQVLFEVETLHHQDLAIFASGVKPYRDISDQVRMAAIRRKDARSSGQRIAPT